LKWKENEYGYEYEIIPVIRWGWGWNKSLIPVGFVVWDSETCSRPVPLPSLCMFKQIHKNEPIQFVLPGGPSLLAGGFWAEPKN